MIWKWKIMLTDHAKLLRFFEETKHVEGRKKLQKMIYILQSSGFPFEEKYQFHFYGPYSEELSLRMEELCNLGFIREVKEDKGNYSQYIYDVTQEGLDFSHQFDLQMPDFREQAQLLQAESSRFLELMATMLYFKDLPKQMVEEKVYVVKPKQHFTVEEMEKAWKLIEKVRQ